MSVMPQIKPNLCKGARCMSIKSCFFCAILLTLNTVTYAEDVENGKELHDENCTSCHSSPDFYTNKDRKRTTYAGLEHQVRSCDNTLDLSWFDEEIEDVTAYLNVTYYQFKKPVKK